MIQANSVVGGAAARVFIEQPERVAAAWRRRRYMAVGQKGIPDNLLDGCVEDFVRQIGHSLGGLGSPAWSRTRGVVRLSLNRDPRVLSEEFDALRECLIDALMSVEAGTPEREVIVKSIDEAVESCLALCKRLKNPDLPPPRVPFGGLVIEVFGASPRPHAAAPHPPPSTGSG